MEIRRLINKIPLTWYSAVISFFSGLMTYPLFTTEIIVIIEKTVPSFIFFVFTVAIIERLQRKREKLERLTTLLRRCSSKQRHTAVAALEELRAAGQLEPPKSVLAGKRVRHGNWKSANLFGADLRGCDLSKVILDGAKLTGANLTKAKLVPSDQKLAALCQLVGGSKVTSEDLLLKKLGSVAALHGAILPNGRVYNGYFELSVDLAEAKRCGVDTSNDKAMAIWYGVGLTNYRNKLYVTK